MARVIGSVLLLLALVLAPIIGGGFGELTNGILQILVFVGVGLSLLRCCKTPGAWARVPGLIALGAFVLLCVIATFHGRAIYYSLNQLLFILTGLGAYLLSATVCRDKRVAAAAVWALLLSALFVSAPEAGSYLGDIARAVRSQHSLAALFGATERGRLFGSFVNPNFYAGSLVIALPITLAAYLVTRRTVLALFAGIGFAVEMLALMGTGAKFGILAAVASLAVFFLLAILTKSLRRSKFTRLLVVCVVTLLVCATSSGLVRYRIRAAEAGGSQVHSTEFRLYTWEATLHMIQDRPLLGVGPGNYPIDYRQYTIAGYTTHAHNSYLQIAAECGVPALVAFVLLLAAVARGSLLGTAAGSTRGSDHPRQDSDAPSHVADSMAWTDLVPFSAWRLMNCALFAALVGSGIRNLIDSDWYVMGIWLPFWVVAGVLVSQSGAAQADLSPGKALRGVLAGLCAVAVVVSISFGLGDFYGARVKSLQESASMEKTELDRAEVVDLYRRASAASPLNPEYHRDLGMWLDDPDAAESEIETSIRLAPDAYEGWDARATLAGARQDWPAAIRSLETALKLSPYSTKTLSRLALAYLNSGDPVGCEKTLRRLLEIENSTYEEQKGTPEMVDITYAQAHAYIGGRDLGRKRYTSAVAHYAFAIDRLERWRGSGDHRRIQQMWGMVDEGETLDLLRECYAGLAAAYTELGNRTEAAQALQKAGEVK